MLYPQVKGLWYPLHRRLGGPQSWYGCFGKREKSIFPGGI